ncbi:MAG: M20/M25/M40 family metallo-hydrolase [Tissierellaceae bacterium]|nr:M20/M25/M40 family metallo-hydrolase [Tissierellaceae bacterium]
MNKSLASRIEHIAIELTNQLSVVETPGELDATQKIYDILSQIDYFKENPKNLKFIDVPNDTLGRKSVIAMLKGKKGNSKRTVLLIGHTDTVGISDYGNLKEYANKPYELTEKFKEISRVLPEEVRKDLESGEYLFGRGLFDMKTGDAIIIALMEEISKDINNFEGNLIFAAVCDEEGNSGGMLSVIPELVKLQEQEGLEYLALIDADYMTSEFEGDENKYIYIGTVGKLMPSFYLVGKETHVGEAFKGIDPNQISSSILNRINLNTEFCDVVEGEVTLPPISLKQRDLKPEYSVQIANTSTLFFNYATFKSTPDEVLAKMKSAAIEAFQSSIDNLNIQYERFCELTGRKFSKLPWKARVMSYEELYLAVKSEIGNEIDIRIDNLTREMLKDENVDQRDFSLKLVEEVHSLWSDREPVVIVYFTPPYYPHIYVEGNTPKEQALLRAVKDAVNTTKSDYKLIYKKFFPYISDLSYGAAPKDPKIISALKDNMPGYGTKYKLPLEDMQKLDLPVLDIGAFGKDAHKFTERIEKKYSFEVAPELLYKTIMNLLNE